MSMSLYKEFLVEEEKFLKVLERNLKDQINRLKVEELSLLKLISGSDPSQYGNSSLTDHELLPDDMPLFPADGTTATETSALQHNEDIEREPEVNPNTSSISTPMNNDDDISHKTWTDYAGFLSHSNNSIKLDESNNSTTDIEQNNSLKKNVQSNIFSSELNNSGTPVEPSNLTTPIHSHTSTGDNISVNPATIQVNNMETSLPINSPDETVDLRNTYHLNDVSVNVIPLNLDLVNRSYNVQATAELKEVEEEDEEEFEEEDTD